MKPLSVLFLLAVSPVVCLAETPMREQAEAALQKGVAYFHSISRHGGYVYYVTTDLKLRWGESPADENTIEVQPPGTPAVGMSFLRAFKATADSRALQAAKDAAFALIDGMNALDGWDHTIDFNNVERKSVSFDDNQSQSAVSFLMALDQQIDDERLSQATQRAIAMMMRAQLPNGGWPHRYPEQGNYHDYATFNDGGINDCVRVMIEARNYYPENREITVSLKKAARFLEISQLPPPQPGWAQQYNEYLQPAWARSFEPPSICPAATVKNLNTLIDLYMELGDATLLEPIPDSLRWLQEIRLENGKWARFVEIGTNQPLYYDRGRIRVASLDELHPERRTGYAYETDLNSSLEAVSSRFETAKSSGLEGLRQRANPVRNKDELNRRLDSLASRVAKVVADQAEDGSWITRNDRFKTVMPRGERWNGQYTVMDRISSSVFNRNVALLCEYVELSTLLEQP